MGSADIYRGNMVPMKEPSVRQNIIANFVGKTWTSIMGLVFIPLYIKFMGIEAYGLIGIFFSLQALFGFLDMGLSSTLSRELARLSTSRESDQEARDLVRTLELIYWGVGILIGLALVALAPVIAHHWITTQGISRGTAQQAIMIMGLIVAVQWPVALYDGGLMGLQQQVLLNGLRMVMATVQHGGAILALWLISPTIITYFAWQIFAGMAQAVLLAYFLWKYLPATRRKSTFQMTLLRKNWRYAAGLTSTSVMAIILTQSDKVILSRMLPLSEFGYYTLAINLAGALSLLVSPVFSALFPKLSQLIVDKDSVVLVSEYYHKGCQVASIIVLPAACILVLFSHQLLLLWVRDPMIAQNSHLLLSLLAIGSAFNATTVIPTALQLAYGWTKLSFLKNLISVVIIVPLMIWLIHLFGATGAAIAWIIVNTGYFFIEIPVMHYHLLKHDMWRWYFSDVGTPLLIVLGVAICSRLIMPQMNSQYFTFAWIVSTGGVALLSSTLAMPVTREWLKRSAA
jgi:O-antigen/teichoic acid export membrane protein